MTELRTWADILRDARAYRDELREILNPFWPNLRDIARAALGDAPERWLALAADVDILDAEVDVFADNLGQALQSALIDRLTEELTHGSTTVA